MRKLLFTAAIFVAFSTSSIAQKIGDIYNSDSDKLQRAFELEADSSFAAAIALLREFENGDTLFDVAQYEIAYLYDQMDRQDSGLIEINQLLNRRTSMRGRAFLLKSDLLNSLERYDESLAVGDQFISEYPNSEMGYRIKAGVYAKMKQFDKALANYTEALRLNPYNNKTHTSIGTMAAQANQSALAAMAFYFAGITGTSNADVVIGNIVVVELIGADEYEQSELYKGLNPELFAFAEELEPINDVVRSKVPLSDQYKAKIKNGFNFMKIMQAISELLPATTESEHPIMQFYCNFYKQMWDKGHFIGMATQPLISIRSDKAASLVKKNSKKISAFANAAESYLVDKMSNQKVIVGGKTITSDISYVDGDRAIGIRNESGQPEGTWYYFHDNGMLMSTGNYENGKRDGEWWFYHDNGLAKEHGIFDNGSIDGVIEFYASNGVLTETRELHGGVLRGKAEVYHSNGSVSVEYNISNDQLNGPLKRFTTGGTLDELTEYVNGKKGKVIGYYPNENINYEIPSVNGVLEGSVKYLYEDGSLFTSAAFAKDSRTGTWTWYFEDGKVMKEGNYADGKETGEWKEYDMKGVLRETTTYKNGNLDGPSKIFDHNGKLQAEIEYRNGKGIRYAYFDENGVILKEAKVSGGKLAVENYNELRIKSSEGTLEKEDRVGTWKNYYLNGLLESEVSYEDGLLEGAGTYYYPTGQVQLKLFFKKGQKHGYYERYDEAGWKSESGYYLDGELHGPIYEFYSNGVASSYQFYWKGLQNGSDINFMPDGKKGKEYLYSYGVLQGALSYGFDNDVVGSTSVPGGNGDYTLYWANGQKEYQGKLVNGNMEGDVVSYNSNGLEVGRWTGQYGNRNGMSVRYYNNGVKSNEGAYKDGLKTGVWTFYRLDGTADWTETYKEGDLTGLSVLNYPDGKKYQERNYLFDEREGDLILYGEDGSVGCVLNYHLGVLLSYTYLGKDGKYVPAIPLVNETGKVVAYYKNGKKSIEFEVLGGEYQGTFTSYYTTGKVHRQFTYEKGYQIGSGKTYWSNGQIAEDENFNKGLQDGAYVEYYANGKKMYESNYVQGILHGPVRFYDKTGKITLEGEYYYGNFYEKK